MENKINDRLKHVIEAQNLTNRKMALKIDMNCATVNTIINGSRKPNVEIIRKFVDLIGVNANWLLTGKGNIYIVNDENPEKQLKQKEQYITNLTKLIDKLEAELDEFKKGSH